MLGSVGSGGAAPKVGEPPRGCKYGKSSLPVQIRWVGFPRGRLSLMVFRFSLQGWIVPPDYAGQSDCVACWYGS